MEQIKVPEILIPADYPIKQNFSTLQSAPSKSVKTRGFLVLFRLGQADGRKNIPIIYFSNRQHLSGHFF